MQKCVDISLFSMYVMRFLPARTGQEKGIDKAAHPCYPYCTRTLSTVGGAYVPSDHSDPGARLAPARRFASRRAVQTVSTGGVS